MFLRPSDICYSQDSISSRFDRHSEHAGQRIDDTLDDISQGRCSIDDIPPIRVTQQDDRWVTSDNRRLWVFRNLEQSGQCDEIPVQEMPYIPGRKLTSSNYGQEIEVRPSPEDQYENTDSEQDEDSDYDGACGRNYGGYGYAHAQEQHERHYDQYEPRYEPNYAPAESYYDTNTPNNEYYGPGYDQDGCPENNQCNRYCDTSDSDSDYY